MRYFFGKTERPSLFVDHPSSFCGSVLDSKGDFHTLEFHFVDDLFSLCFDACKLLDSICFSVFCSTASFSPDRVRYGSDAQPAKTIELFFRVPLCDTCYCVTITKTYIDINYLTLESFKTKVLPFH